MLFYPGHQKGNLYDTFLHQLCLFIGFHSFHPLKKTPDESKYLALYFNSILLEKLIQK